MKYLPLVSLRAGEYGKVAQITAGGLATKRLYEMGFNTGADVRVLKNDRGPMIVALCGNKIALGRGLAAKMLISEQ